MILLTAGCFIFLIFIIGSHDYIYLCRAAVGRQTIHDYSLGCGYLKSVIFGGVDGLIISLSVISGAAG